MDKTLISIVGPTAIGKTSLSLKVAKHFKTEIMSCDSRQFYKEMKIGTAVPSDAELAEVKHHFIKNKSIQDYYSVGDFEKDALRTAEALFKQHDVLILTGGSGLYQNAVLYGLDDFPEVNKAIREELNLIYATKGIEPLQKELKELDPKHYENVDKQNPQRLIRALEICKSSEKPYSFFLTQSSKKRLFKSLKIGLTAEREIIYDRINKRVDIMFKEGLLEEAKELYAYRNLNALKTVGYAEIFDYLDGKLTLEEATSEIKKNTRRYAKRQLTWYRKQEDILWFEMNTDPSTIIEQISKKILL
jgi:tRNA dimethylallyltransferase